MKRVALIMYTVAVAAMSTSALADTRKPYSLPMPYAPLPKYPEEARVTHWTGTALFLIKADADAGVVNGVTTIRSAGRSILDKAAEEALYRWKFPRESEPEILLFPSPSQQKALKSHAVPGLSAQRRDET
jgi:TonB family protein